MIGCGWIKRSKQDQQPVEFDQELGMPKEATKPSENQGETKRIETDRLRKPNLQLNGSFNLDEGVEGQYDNGFDMRYPLETPDFKGRIVIGEPKTSARAHQIPSSIEEGDQETQE